MRKTTQALAVVAATIALGASAKPFRETFPLGVYTGWERNAYNAKVAGVSTSEYVDRLLGICHGFNCDTIWVVNGPRGNRDEFLSQCGKHGMKALLNSDLQVYFHQPFTGDWGDLDAKIAKSIAELAGFDSFLGYVLKDEPKTPTVDQIDAFGKALPDAGVIATRGTRPHVCRIGRRLIIRVAEPKEQFRVRAGQLRQTHPDERLADDVRRPRVGRVDEGEGDGTRTRCRRPCRSARRRSRSASRIRRPRCVISSSGPSR